MAIQLELNLVLEKLQVWVLKVGDAVGFGAEFATPLFHTSFFPLFTQVYFLPALVEVAPTFLQVSPAFTAAIALKEERCSRTAISFFTKIG